MTTFIDWLLILAIALCIFGVLCSVIATVQHLACIVVHWWMRSWSAEMQCALCGEDVHLARVHPIYNSLGRSQ